VVDAWCVASLGAGPATIIFDDTLIARGIYGEEQSGEPITNPHRSPWQRPVDLQIGPQPFWLKMCRCLAACFILAVMAAPDLAVVLFHADVGIGSTKWTSTRSGKAQRQ
jgi:hypothetical protein